MKIYMFDGDLLCKQCGEAIAATLPDPDAWEREHPDSCSYPVAYDSSEGESDSPDHCVECGLFLERNLTDVGRQYVQDYIYAGWSSSNITELWGEFYGIPTPTGQNEA